MSSILDKIRTAINASMRGTRPSQRRSGTPTQDTPRDSVVPEITDANQDRAELPEITDAPLTSLRESSSLSSPAPHASLQSPVTLDLTAGERV
jgi:hypothetical protein